MQIGTNTPKRQLLTDKKSAIYKMANFLSNTKILILVN